jgi:predicted DNA-binding WGR domain protein
MATTKRYVFRDGTSHKFWEVQLNGTSFTTRWGKVGTDGQHKTLQNASAVAAKKAVEALIKEKTGKGYQAVSHPSKTAKPVSAKAVNSKVSPAKATQAIKVGGTKRINLAPLLLGKAQCLRRGTLTVAQFVKAAKVKTFTTKDGMRQELKERAQDPDSYSGDMYLWEGDLVVDGDFCTIWKTATTKYDDSAQAHWLVVTGNLIIHGNYEDTNHDSPDHVYVMGDMRAHNLQPTGFLEVYGDLMVRDTAVFAGGDWAFSKIHGDVKTTALDVTTHHAIEVKGKIVAKFVVGEPDDLNIVNAKRHKLVTTAWDKIPWAGNPANLNELEQRICKGQPTL